MLNISILQKQLKTYKAMKKYKLTDQNMQTYKGFQWELNKEVCTDGNSNKLCNSHWLHYYHHLLLAILLNPIHSNIINPRLFECKVLGKHLNDKGLKGGCTKMTLVKELKIPVITTTQKIAFAILCSLKVYKDRDYIIWANNWLSNKNRTHAAADAAARAATDAATRAACVAADAACVAADAAARAADAATYAADAATYTADAARAATYAAARAAARAADAAAHAAATYAADAATYTADAARADVALEIDLIIIAKKAIKL